MGRSYIKNGRARSPRRPVICLASDKDHEMLTPYSKKKYKRTAKDLEFRRCRLVKSYITSSRGRNIDFKSRLGVLIIALPILHY